MGEKFLLDTENALRSRPADDEAVKDEQIKKLKQKIEDMMMGEIHPTGKEQRCWNHKITNVLNNLPNTVQSQAAERLKAMPYAETKGECERLRDAFVRRTSRLTKSRGDAASGLGSDGDLLFISPSALVAHTDNKH